MTLSLGPVVLDLDGKALSPEERELLQHPQVGGVILFSRNYESLAQLKELLKEIHRARPTILTAVDQEGGRVQRFREEFTRLPPLAEFGELYQKNPQQAKQAATESAKVMASELLRVGIDISFAPVLDVDQGINQVIGDRSFSRDPNVVTELGKAYIKGMNSVGMMAVGKHFPGHGAVVADSHKELPIDNRDYQTIWDKDLLPYSKVSALLAGIMSAHIVYPNIDNKPATFSAFWLKKILRKQLNFQGAVFSDDLAMLGAASYGGDYSNRAQLALAAGCDMVLVCNDRQGVIAVLESLKRYVVSPESRQRVKKLCRH